MRNKRMRSKRRRTQSMCTQSMCTHCVRAHCVRECVSLAGVRRNRAHPSEEVVDEARLARGVVAE
eukprot:6190443-Pleurochrysis_carterae.AAC.7